VVGLEIYWLERCPLIEKEYAEEIKERFRLYDNLDFILDWSRELNE